MKFGNMMLFQYFPNMVTFRCQTRNAPRGDGTLMPRINPPASFP